MGALWVLFLLMMSKLKLSFLQSIVGIVSVDFKWNAPVESICKKAATSLDFLKKVKCAYVSLSDMLLFYTTCIHSILEYAYPVFHSALLQYLSNDMDRL